MDKSPDKSQLDSKQGDQYRQDRLAKARSIVDLYQQGGAEANPPQIHTLQDAPDFRRTPRAETGSEDTDQALYLKARETAVRYIGLDKGKSSGEVRDSLMQKGYDSDLASRVVHDLIALGYIDDKRACAKIARRHHGKRAKSRSYMKFLFIQQGVQEDVAESYLEVLPSDSASLEDFLCDQMSDLDGADREARLVRRLQSRGYNYGLITRAIRRLKETHAR